MNKMIITSLLLAELLLGIEIPIDEVERQLFQDEIRVNAKIIQLSSAKENVMARVGGKISRYLIKQGDKVKRGQAIAKIESLEVAKLFSELKLLRKQLVVHNKNYKILKNLYVKGLESMQNVNKEERERDETASKIQSIKAQLQIMGLKPNAKGKSVYTIHAQGAGKVAKILVPSHSVVDANTPLVSIVKGGESYLVNAYVPLNYVNSVKVGQKGSLLYGARAYQMHVTQILPELDRQSQQMQVLLALDEPVNNLFVNAYVDSTLFIGTPQSYLSVKKSALSFFNNEWVVFVPKHHEEHAGHDHEEEKGGHDGHEALDEHAGHDHEEEKGGHEGHDEEEVPYDIRVVKILKQNSQWVAIEGLEEHEDYVSSKSYYIKSMLLKSSLGGHGH